MCLQEHAPSHKQLFTESSNPNYIKLATEALHSAHLLPAAQAAVRRQLADLAAAASLPLSNGCQMDVVNKADTPPSAQQKPELCAESTSTDLAQQHVKLQPLATDETQQHLASNHSLPTQEQLYKEHQQRRKKQPSAAALATPSSQHHNSADAAASKAATAHDQQPGTPAADASTKPSNPMAGNASQPQRSKHAQRSSPSSRARHKKRLHGVKLVCGAWRVRVKYKDVRQDLGIFPTGVDLPPENAIQGWIV